MKFEFSCEPEELPALLTALREILGTDGALTPFEEADEDEADVDDAQPSKSAKPLATVTPMPVAPVASPEAIDQNKAKLLHGRDLWLALIEMWGENWNVEGAPQPDRVGTLLRLLHSDGKSILAYLATKAGLTDATRDVLCELRQRPLDNAIKREARLYAENIAQVCSFHAPNMTDLLEYSAEYHILPE